MVSGGSLNTIKTIWNETQGNLSTRREHEHQIDNHLITKVVKYFLCLFVFCDHIPMLLLNIFCVISEGNSSDNQTMQWTGQSAPSNWKSSVEALIARCSLAKPIN